MRVMRSPRSLPNFAAHSPRTWTGLTLLLGLLLGLSGCRRVPEDDRTVEFWTMQLQPAFNEYFDERIAAFEAEYPQYEVRWVDIPWSAMEAKILTAVSAQTAPDVANLNPNFASLLAGRNAWLTLDDLPEEVRSRYLDNIWAASRFGDRSLGIPWYLTTRVTLYNTELLQAANLTQPPATFTELAAAARQIKAKTGKYAVFVSFAPNDSGEVLESLVQMGVTLTNPDGTAAFNSPEGREAFEYWVRLYRDDLLPRDVLTQGHQRAIELYQAGELAFLATGPQFLKTIANNAPDVAAATRAAPQITGETGKIAVAVMNLWVPRDTDNPEGAIAFSLFVTNPDNQLAFSQAANTLPSTAQTLEHPYFERADDPTTQLDDARVLSADQLRRAQVLVPPLPNTGDLQQILYENLQAAMLGEKDISTALNDAEADWNAIVASWRSPAP